MMKRLIVVLTALAMTLSVSGCVTVGFSENMRGRESVQGKGNMTTVDFECGDFSELEIDLDFYNNTGDTAAKLYYAAEKSDKVTFEIQEDLVQYLIVTTDGGVLTIDSEKSFEITDESKAPKIYVSAPVLEGLRIDGAVRIEKADKITADSFKFAVKGVCKSKLDLEVKDLNVVISGVGDITLNGTADKAFIRMAGVGNLAAFGLQTREADVETSGVGNIEISCSDKLNAKASSVGVISYKGNPSTSIRENGIGRVTKVD